MFLTNFEKCEWCAAFLDSCASNKRTYQIQNKLIKNATDKSKIRSDQKRFFIALSQYPLSFFANTPFKRVVKQMFFFKT